jgi:hypothetical protein
LYQLYIVITLALPCPGCQTTTCCMFKSKTCACRSISSACCCAALPDHGMLYIWNDRRNSIFHKFATCIFLFKISAETWQRSYLLTAQTVVCQSHPAMQTKSRKCHLLSLLSSIIILDQPKIALMLLEQVIIAAR